jgi:hypothetical protein
MKTVGYTDLRSTRPKTKNPRANTLPFRSESEKIDLVKKNAANLSLTTKSSLSFVSKTTIQPSSSDISEISEDALKRLHAMIKNFILLDNGSFANDIDLQKYSLESGQVVTNLLLQELSIIQPNIISLNLSQCKEITDVGLWAIAKHCNPNSLQVLNLSGCYQITNIGLRSLSLKCHSIHTFIFNDCINLDDMLLTVIASGSWNLRQLYLRNCRGITDTGISRISRVGSALEVLDLHGCSGIGEFGENAMKDIGLYCGNLLKLDLSYCKRIEDYGLRSLALGCVKLEELILHDCEFITGISVQAIFKHCKHIHTLGLIKCIKLIDSDLECLYQSHMRSKLFHLNISGCIQISDRGIRAIANSLTSTLIHLNLSGCKQLSDQSNYYLAEHCSKLQELELSRCPKLTDLSIQHLAMGKTRNIISLKLTRNPHITIKSLFQYLDRFEFASMSQDWLGYQPRSNAYELIRLRERQNFEYPFIVKIQSMIRRQYAYRECKKRRRYYIIKNYIPKLQALARGYLQRRRYQMIKRQIHRIHCIVKIQAWYRKYIHMQRRLKIIEMQKNNDLEEYSSIAIQRVYRGLKARQVVQNKRYEKANQLILEAKIRIKNEKAAVIIQSAYRRHLACELVLQYILRKRQKRELEEKESSACLLIQRIVRGSYGRIIAKIRKQEIHFEIYRHEMALLIQRVYRGHAGRNIAYQKRNVKVLKSRIRAAIYIQKIFRGYIGRLQGSLAYAIKVLRFAKINAVILIQRVIRGKLTRKRMEMYRDDMLRAIKETNAAVKIQKLFRGHKGREGIIIEKELCKFDEMVKPLTDNLQKLEKNQKKLKNIIDNAMEELRAEHDDLNKLEMELEFVLHTENKYCDSSRLTNYPQRYLTKYLRIRLQEYYDNKKVCPSCYKQ